MSTPSLEQHLKRLAIQWALAGLSLTAGLSVSLFVWLFFAEAESEVQKMARAALNSYRLELLSGGVKSVELQLNRTFSISGSDSIVFLDANKNRRVKDFSAAALAPCNRKTHVCRDWSHRKIIVEQPLYYDDEGEKLWGYIHIESSPHPNWTIIFSVVLAILIGMTFQIAGFYTNLRKAVSTIGLTLKGWAGRLSENPKDTKAYGDPPYQELWPIGQALAGLKSEIDNLESEARKQGALTTLRGIGHDILNPVSRIKRAMGLLRARVPEQENLLNTLDSNLKRLSGYAEQIKALYRSQTGEALNDNNFTNASEEVRAMVAEIQFEGEASTKGIHIQTQISDDCFIQIPPTALSRVIENLCSNSIHASPENSTITVSVSRRGGEVELAVHDQGEGIPEEIQDKIFEANYTTKKNKGTGLGLFVVKEIAEVHGGRISVQSRVGEGTEFKLSFPFMR